MIGERWEEEFGEVNSIVKVKTYQEGTTCLHFQ